MTPQQAGELAGNKLSFGLLKEERRPTDWIHGEEERLGGSQWTKLKPVLTINGDKVVSWDDDEPGYEVQRKAFETNACVSFSGNNCFEYLANRECKINPDFKRALDLLGLIKNDKVDVSDRRTAKGSNTDPERGNYVSKVDDYIRNFLFCPEDMWPFLEGMLSAEYYKDMTPEVATYGEKIKPLVKIETKYVSGQTVSTPDQLWDALQYSPIWASVDGFDQRNADDIIEGFSGYTHRISIKKIVYGKYIEIKDHYNSQIKKYAWNYPFGNCKIMQINPQKKSPSFQLVKAKGSPAVYLQVLSGNLYAISDGEEASGGDILKACSGTYKNAGIKIVDQIDLTKVVGELTTRKK